MLITKFFPQTAIFFSEDGITSSEAQKLKNINSNESNRLTTGLNPIDLYYRRRTTVGVTTTESESEQRKRVTPDSFKVLDRVSELNSKNAVYGQAIQYKELLRELINELDNDTIAENANIETVKNPIRKQSVRIDIEKFCEKDKIEEMYRLMNTELTLQCQDFYATAIKEESKAAAYSNYYTKADSFIRCLFNSKQTRDVRFEKVDGVGLIEITDNLIYDKDEFVEVQNELTEKHNLHQTERNRYVAKIKDLARRIDRKYEEEFLLKLSKYNEYVAKCNSIKSQLLNEAANLKIKTF